VKSLVIDNHDSFTYNLVHLLAELNGEEPLVVKNDETDWATLARETFDNIVISPGPGRPDRAADFGLSADAIRAARVPLLGVCLGHQGIATHFGGSVERAPEPMHGRVSRIRHDGDSLFDGIPGAFGAVRYHSLVVARPLPAPLVEIAWSADGLIMALRHRDRPIYGVQFHPESILTDHGRKLIGNFRDITQAREGGRRPPPPRIPASPSKIEPSREPGNVLWREAPHVIDAESCFKTLFAESAHAFWLDSAATDNAGGRWSYLGDGAATLRCDGDFGRVSIRDDTGERIESGDIFTILDRFRAGSLADPPPCPFAGGFVGWFGYELRDLCGSPTGRRADSPAAFFIRPGRFIAIDHQAGKTYAIARADDRGGEARLEAMLASLADLRSVPMPKLGNRTDPITFTLRKNRADYVADIERSLNWIRDGETYQVCLTNELTADVDLDPLTLYRVMRRTNPAPFAAFLRWPGGAILSASPERFLSVDKTGKVEAKPIKGTIGRDPDPLRDRGLARRLQTSEKERAENLMIVDLLRNDLSRVSVPGSVEVPSLMEIETFTTLHQLVSTVRAQLKPGAGTVDVIRAAFPGGSMTGAPKLRTLDLIDRLEGRPRGIYSGALGWLGDDGAADLAIVIRTIVQIGTRLSIGIGGGIVAQSDPDAEFDEILLKAKASIAAIVTAATGDFAPGLFRIDGADSS
jgi:para-aminobenzoate synthetase